MTPKEQTISNPVIDLPVFVRIPNTSWADTTARLKAAGIPQPQTVDEWLRAYEEIFYGQGGRPPRNR